MNKSYIGSVDKYGELGKGATSIVYKCDFKDELFAYKEFLDKQYSIKFEEKLEKLTHYYYDNNFVFPYELVYKRLNNGLDQLVGYVMDVQNNSCTLSHYFSNDKIVSRDKKIQILKKCKEKLELLHEKYNIVHCDLYPGNFLYEEDNDGVKIIDFDSSVELKDKSSFDPNLVNMLSELYIKNYGIDKDVDIFLFNLCCFSIINNYNFDQCVPLMMMRKYGEFKSEKSKVILDNYRNLGISKTMKKEYIIDYI